jgi:hypothetical protein
VPRRVRVPAADDLFRPTAVPDQDGADSTQDTVEESVEESVVELAAAKPPAAGRQQEGEGARRTASGRVKHDEKMTVYVTGDELLDIEHARLELRRHHGLAVDRGRLVRAAVAIALAELDEHGADSPLVRRLAAG